MRPQHTKKYNPAKIERSCEFGSCGFFFSTDGWTNLFSQKETTRAHSSASLWSFEPQANVCRDLGDPHAFISDVWSPFHGCGANLFRGGFHEPKPSHPYAKMIWHRQFHPNTVDMSVWLTFTFLPLNLRFIIPGASPMHPKNCTRAI